MSKFQLLSGFINLGGERTNVVFRGPDNPITYPESLLLQVIHGGPEHVHTLVEVGEADRDHEEELRRLTEKYGAVTKSAFPAVGGRATLPMRDDTLPTAEEVAEAKAAMDATLAASKAKRGKTAKAKAKTPAPEPAAPAPAVPSVDDLPS
jgi:hypothetical protein